MKKINLRGNFHSAIRIKVHGHSWKAYFTLRFIQLSSKGLKEYHETITLETFKSPLTIGLIVFFAWLFLIIDIIINEEAA